MMVCGVVGGLLGGLTAWSVAAQQPVRLTVVAPITLQAIGVSDQHAALGQQISGEAEVVAQRVQKIQEFTIAVRDSDGDNFDFTDQGPMTIGTTQTDFIAQRAFNHAGSYTYFAAYEQNGKWTDFSPIETFTVGDIVGPAPGGPVAGDGNPGSPVTPGAPSTPTAIPAPTSVPPTPPPSSGAYHPDGPGGTWNLAFDDEFSGTSVDTSQWAYDSSAEPDDGDGNLPNNQLEWDQAQNCSVGGGELTITSRRQNVTSPSGTHYSWTSCLLTTTPSYEFQYGYMETRAEFPSQVGFWPGFWTWQAGDSYIETDAFEFYSNDQGQIFLTQHSGRQGGCQGLSLGFNPASAFHTYGVDIEPSGTTWYIDGRPVCSASGTSTGLTNIILNDFVYAKNPPSSGTDSATEEVQYVRSWQHP
jgi:Glycosyl hydrolases family 16